MCTFFCRKNLFSSHTAVVKVIEKGSMDMYILQAVRKHISKFIRKEAGNVKVFQMTLGDYKSVPETR